MQRTEAKAKEGEPSSLKRSLLQQSKAFLFSRDLTSPFTEQPVRLMTTKEHCSSSKQADPID